MYGAAGPVSLDVPATAGAGAGCATPAAKNINGAASKVMRPTIVYQSSLKSAERVATSHR
jgi:hypothetical protein